MIERRQFFGSVAAAITVLGTSRFSTASIAEPNSLNWHCEVIETVAHHKGRRRPVVTGVSLQPTGDLMAVVGDDHFVCIYDRSTEKFTEHLNRHTDWIRAAKFTPDGNKLVTAGNDRMLHVWEVNSWGEPKIERRHPEAIIEIAFSSDGQKLVTVGFENRLRVYDMVTGTELNQLKCPCPDNHAVAFSPDNTLLAAGGRCGSIRVWDTATWKQISQFKAHRQRIRSIEFTTDGRVVSAGDDQKVVFTDPNNPRAATALPRVASKLYATALLDADMMATGGSDNKIRIWQVSTLQELGILKGHTGTVSCLDYSDGKLVSGSYDTHVRLWSAESHTSAPGQRHTQLRHGWNRKIK